MRTVEKGFKILEHTADVGIIAYGTDIREVFANAAVGLFSLIAEMGNIREDIQQELELSAEDEEELLVKWLNELIYIFDVEHIIFSRFEINELTSNQIKARCFGQRIISGQHELKREVKAATYHMLKISKSNTVYEAQIIFDI